jgi:hypothetical protein
VGGAENNLNAAANFSALAAAVLPLQAPPFPAAGQPMMNAAAACTCIGAVATAQLHVQSKYSNCMWVKAGCHCQHDDQTRTFLK